MNNGGQVNGASRAHLLRNSLKQTGLARRGTCAGTKTEASGRCNPGTRRARAVELSHKHGFCGLSGPQSLQKQLVVSGDEMAVLLHIAIDDPARLNRIVNLIG
jgi:hypothetical protein